MFHLVGASDWQTRMATASQCHVLFVTLIRLGLNSETPLNNQHSDILYSKNAGSRVDAASRICSSKHTVSLKNAQS